MQLSRQKNWRIRQHLKKSKKKVKQRGKKLKEMIGNKLFLSIQYNKRQWPKNKEKSYEKMWEMIYRSNINSL